LARVGIATWICALLFWEGRGEGSEECKWEQREREREREREHMYVLASKWKQS